MEDFIKLKPDSKIGCSSFSFIEKKINETTYLTALNNMKNINNRLKIFVDLDKTNRTKYP